MIFKAFRVAGFYVIEMAVAILRLPKRSASELLLRWLALYRSSTVMSLLGCFKASAAASAMYSSSLTFISSGPYVSKTS